MWVALALAVSALSAQAQTVAPTSSPTPTPRLSFDLQTPDVVVGGSPQEIAAGKFTSSGNVDLAVANYETADVSVLLGNGSGGFTAAPIPISLGSPDSVGPSAIAVGNFDGDSQLDIIVADELSSTVNVLLNQGSGTFSEPKVTETGTSPEAIVVGHFNNDGKLYVATADLVDDTVTILESAGDGMFTKVQVVHVGVEPTALAMGSFNDDAFPDLVVVNDAGGGDAQLGSITVLKGLGGGMFEAQPEFSSPAFNYPVAIAVGDVDGDLKDDVAVVNQDAGLCAPALPNAGQACSIDDDCNGGTCVLGTVAVLLGQGTLTFANAASLSVGADSVPDRVVIADFNGDGSKDIATSADFGDKVSVFLGRGTGAFMPGVDVSVGQGKGPLGLAVDDFNNDQKPDLATANIADDSVSVLLNTSEQTLPLCIGDCHGRTSVGIDDLMTMVNIALGSGEVAACTAGVPADTTAVTVDQIVAATSNALNGCNQ